jgi:tetratricopeptide (TPR) repeat protein
MSTTARKQRVQCWPTVLGSRTRTTDWLHRLAKGTQKAAQGWPRPANGQQRWDKILEKCWKKLAKADKRLARAYKRLAKADKRLARAYKRLARADKRLARADKRLARADKRLARAYKRLARADKRLARAYKRLARAYKRLARADKRLARAGQETRARCSHVLAPSIPFHHTFGTSLHVRALPCWEAHLNQPVVHLYRREQTQPEKHHATHSKHKL